jgi:hypothetical protein
MYKIYKLMHLNDLTKFVTDNPTTGVIYEYNHHNDESMLLIILI